MSDYEKATIQAIVPKAFQSFQEVIWSFQKAVCPMRRQMMLTESLSSDTETYKITCFYQSIIKLSGVILILCMKNYSL